MAYKRNETFDDVIVDMKKWADEDIERNAGMPGLLSVQAKSFIDRLKTAVGEERVKAMYDNMRNQQTTTTIMRRVVYGRPVLIDNRSLLEKAVDGIESIFV